METQFRAVATEQGSRGASLKKISLKLREGSDSRDQSKTKGQVLCSAKKPLLLDSSKSKTRAAFDTTPEQPVSRQDQGQDSYSAKRLTREFVASD